MMVSMTAAGIASQYHSPRTIGLVAGILSSSTAIFWGYGELEGKLPEPEPLTSEDTRKWRFTANRGVRVGVGWEPRKMVQGRKE